MTSASQQVGEIDESGEVAAVDYIGMRSVDVDEYGPDGEGARNTQATEPLAQLIYDRELYRRLGELDLAGIHGVETGLNDQVDLAASLLQRFALKVRIGENHIF